MAVRILAFSAVLVLLLQLAGVAALARYRAEVAEVFALPLPESPLPPQPVPVVLGETATEEETAAFQDTLLALGKAIENADGPGAGRQFDIERMLDEMVQTGVRKQAAPADRGQVVRTIEQGVERSLLGAQLHWNQVYLRRVRFLNVDRTEAMLIVRHRHDKGDTAKVRWWIRRGVNGWRLYDMENLHVGVRLTLTTGQVTLARMARERDALLRLTNAAKAIRAKHLDEGARMIERFENEPLSLPGSAYRWQVKAQLALARRDPGEALHCIDRAELIQPHPLTEVWRAAAHNELGEHEKALEHGRKAIQVLGDDADAYGEIGLAASKDPLGRDDARTAYRAALAEEPSLNHLRALWALLRDGEKAEVGEWLAKMPTPRVHFNTLFAEVLNANDLDSADALVDGYRKIAPTDPTPDLAKSRINIRRKKVNIAIAQFKNAIKKVPNEDERRERVLAFLDEMLAAGKSVEAYRAAPDPALAFVYLHGKLEGKVDRADELRRLIAEHEKRK